jgi:pyridoxal phosphate enzyme (YggS family)
MISENVDIVLNRIRKAEKQFNRSKDSVKLLAVSKKCSIEQIMAAHEAGLQDYGESYLQEAQSKITALAKYPLTWHFIGPVQSNKTKDISACFDWVHSIDRLKIAQRLNEQRPADLDPLNVCIQVNMSKERTKSGILLEALPELVDAVSQLSALRLRGLMTIPAPGSEFEAQRIPYRKLHQAFQALRDTGYNLDTLSMGMSSDLEAAIAEGATMVRIGAMLFGERTR